MSYRTFLAIGTLPSAVYVDLDTMLGGVERPAIRLTFSCSGDLSAALLANRLREQRDALVREAVAQGYADGYRDGRAKRGKREYHSYRLGRDIP